VTALPFVTAVIPCRNEAAFVGPFLESVLANDYPTDRLELLVVDGQSDDGTREIVRRYSEKCPRVRLVDNPQRTKPSALNTGIRRARGEVIVRLDVHAHYPRSYISGCVRGLLDHPDADNVGGVMTSRARTDRPLGRAIALCLGSAFGVGNARFRVGTTRPRWVDTVFGGCYRRELFERIGLFDETLIRAQDREFNQRLRAAGGRILLLPDVECTYYPRSAFRDHCSWIFEAGYWPYYASRLADRWIGSWRNVVPAGFVVTSAVGAASAFVSPLAGRFTAAVGTAYGLALLGVSARLARRHRDARLLLALPVAFATTHLLYGVGSLWGIVAPRRHGAAG